jgi:hypothetical protein
VPAKSSRREFIKSTVQSALAGALLPPLVSATSSSAESTASSSTAPTGKKFNLWAFGDAHVGKDLTENRESLTEAIQQSEFGLKDAPSFDWDIAINVGDLSGAHGSPQDDEGEQIVKQYGSLKKHPREAIYDISGNHDRNALGEPDGAWFQKWVDPMGQNSATSRINSQNRPYPTDGTWERYSFRVGNLLFLMMSDVNEPTQTVGRGELGGNPGGVVRNEAFEWWKKMVESNRDSIILTAHHYVLKNTTVASGEWEGMKKKNDAWATNYHGYFEKGTPKGASYLYWVNSKPDAQLFENYLESNPGRVAMWFGGHTHTNPDDRAGGKSHIETKWGTNFLNVCALTRYHVRKHSKPMSRHLCFTEGSDQVRVRCYMHTNEYAPVGWYDKAERIIKLPRPFSRSA